MVLIAEERFTYYVFVFFYDFYDQNTPFQPLPKRPWYEWFFISLFLT